MTTFLFLVSLSASTVLLLAIAAEEALSAARRIFNLRQDAAGAVHPAAALAVAGSVSQLEVRQAQRARAQARSGYRSDEGDRIPDQAA